MTVPSAPSPERRFVSLTLPRFAIENRAITKATSTQRENAGHAKTTPAPFALVGQSARGQRLAALNLSAEQEGLVTGMNLSDALALCPLLHTAKSNPKADRRRLLQLAKWCGRYSPLSNVYDNNSLWIDITGSAHLFGGELNMLAKIQQDFSRLGYTAQLGLADSFGAAFAISRFSPDDDLKTRLVPPAQLQHRLAPLPVDALRLSDKALSLLHRLGLSTIGQLAALPRHSLKRRFPSREQAEAVLLRLDQCLGRRDEPLSPLVPRAVFSARLGFAEALCSKQALEQALVRLIARLTRQLENKNRGARQLTFTLWRSDGSMARINIGTSSPCRDQSHIFRLFREKLGHMEPGDGIDVLALEANRHDPLTARQTSLMDPCSDPSPLALSRLIDRLQNRLGSGKIGYLHTVESHIPERAQQISASPSSCKGWSVAALNENTAPAPTQPDRPFLLLDPPEPIEVMAPLPDDPPLVFIWRRVRRKVMASTPPERLAPEWWRETGHSSARPPARPRDYYKVRTEDGGCFWLYRHGLYDDPQNDERQTPQISPQWFMHGLFG